MYAFNKRQNLWLYYINTILGNTRIEGRYLPNMELNTNKARLNDPYPWLEKVDPRRNILKK